MSEIAPSVFAVPHRLVDGKNGIVFGERGALAIDACNWTDEGEAMAQFIRNRGCQPSRLAFTHGHGDHVLGSGAFRGAEVYAHAQAPTTIAKHRQAWATRYFEGSLERADAAVSPPNVLFTSTLRIDLGDKTVDLFPTPGHSLDSVCALVVEDRVLFGGDTAVTGIVPAIQEGDSLQLAATLRLLADLDAEILVPGHGPLVFGAAAVRESLLWNATYLEGLSQFVADALRQGHAPEAIPALAGYGQFVGDRLGQEEHGMLRRHRTTVGCVVKEQTSR